MTILLGGIFAAALAAFGMSLTQARINGRHGTDHAVHTFLINRIRERGGQLFVRIPRLLNEAYIGALPLYLHWVFARFPIGVMRGAEVLLNPTINFLHTVTLGALAWFLSDQIGAPPGFAVATTMLFAFTPQFYHALSARNFGLSARSLGLILLTVTFTFAYIVEGAPGDWVMWTGLALTCYLIFAFSTFGAQALVLIGLFMLALGHWQVAVGTGLGLLVFITIHPRYSFGYLRHTLFFITEYARELAPRYILARRHSVWRDLVRDIWERLRRDGLTTALRYAYENSVLIVVVLAPLTPLAVAAAIANVLPANTIAAYGADVAAAALAAMLLTSFRITRFLGEPERYVEAGAAFATLAAAAAVYSFGGTVAMWGLVLLFATLCAAQVVASVVLSRYLSSKPLRLDDARNAIAATNNNGQVRCASNNEQYLKLMLPNDWWFSYCIAVGHGYCGMKIGEVFDPFPFPRRTALQTIVTSYRITHCLLDRERYGDIFDSPPVGLRGQSVIFESPGVRVIQLDWEDDPARERI